MIDDELHPAKELSNITINSNRIRNQYKLINRTINTVSSELGLYYVCVTPDKNCTTIYPEGHKVVVNLSFSELLDYIPTLTDMGYEVKVYNGYICILWYDNIIKK